VVTQEIEKLVEDFAEHANTQVLQETATNQLLHAVFLRIEHKVDRDDLFKILLPALTNTDTDANPSP
jgi:hypothetical protein